MAFCTGKSCNKHYYIACLDHSFSFFFHLPIQLKQQDSNKSSSSSLLEEPLQCSPISFNTDSLACVHDAAITRAPMNLPLQHIILCKHVQREKAVLRSHFCSYRDGLMDIRGRGTHNTDTDRKHYCRFGGRMSNGHQLQYT